MRAKNPPIAPQLAAAVDRRGTGAAPRVIVVLAIACAACAALLLAPSLPSAQAAACPNEAIRTEQGSAALALPDCRAYELVSPGSIPFVNLTNEEVEGARASTTGNALAYFTRYPSVEAERSGERYLAKRSLSGWAVEDVTPQRSPQNSESLECEPGQEFSPDFSKNILSFGWVADSAGFCPESEEILAPGAPRGYGNLYLRNGSEAYRLVNVTPPGVSPANAALQAYDSDFSHILFQEEAQLTSDAPPGLNLYEWSEGALHFVTILPNGEPVSGKLANGPRYGTAPGARLGLANETNAMSADGENVFFYANGNLYLRRNATQTPTASGTCSPIEPDNACTVQIDRKQGGSGESGGGRFWYSTADASRVFFTAESKLTADSKAGFGKPTLYEYDVVTGLLRNRTHTESSESPNVLGFSGAGEGEAGVFLYFVARGVLTGSGENSEGVAAQPSNPNLYLLHEGDVRFIATLVAGESDELIWYAPAESNQRNSLGQLATVVSPSGRHFSFGSVAPLTGFDNIPADPIYCAGIRCREIFLFDAQGMQLSCVSCSPNGARPTSDTKLPGPTSFTYKTETGWPAYFARQVMDDGRVFFSSANALTTADVNGALDVYEYYGGQHHLISSGAAVGASIFFDASPSGSDVFFATPETLVATDANNGMSIYDARVGGGFSEPPLPPPCEGESCRGKPSDPEDQTTPGSLSFSGPQAGPNHPRRAQCKRGFVMRQGKCRKRPHRPKKHRLDANTRQQRVGQSSNQRNAK